MIKLQKLPNRYVQVLNHLIGKASVFFVGRAQCRIKRIQQGNHFIKLLLLGFIKTLLNSAGNEMIAGEIKFIPDYVVLTIWLLMRVDKGCLQRFMTSKSLPDGEASEKGRPVDESMQQ